MRYLDPTQLAAAKSTAAERAKTMLEPNFAGVVVTDMRLPGMGRRDIPSDRTRMHARCIIVAASSPARAAQFGRPVSAR